MSPGVGLYIFQPYYNGNPLKNFQQSLENAKTKLKASPEKPLHVVLKVMAESVGGHRWRQMMVHARNVGVTIRDPQSQALSAIRALYQVRSGQPMTMEEKAGLKQIKMRGHIRHYVQTPWQNIRTHVDQLTSYHGRGAAYGQRWHVIDGDLMRMASRAMLRRVAESFRVPYTPAMLSGWRDGENKIVGSEHYSKSPFWLRRVQVSDRLKSPSFMTPTLDDFSASMRAQVESNLATYVRVLSRSPSLVTPFEMCRLMDTRGYHVTCPVSAYAMTALWPDRFRVMQASTLDKIRDTMPDYEKSFDLIDRQVTRLGGATPHQIALVA